MAETEGRELGWEDTISKDSSEFEAIPEGDYEFTIEKYERARSQGKGKLPPCNMAVVYFRIADRDREVVIRENFILHSSLEWKLSELFRGIGAKKEGEEVRMNWNLLPGATGRAQVSLDPDRNDPSKKYNHIKKIYPKEIKKFEAGKF